MNLSTLIPAFRPAEPFLSKPRRIRNLLLISGLLILLSKMILAQNVGIGVDDPKAKLEINSGFQDTTLLAKYSGIRGKAIMGIANNETNYATKTYGGFFISRGKDGRAVYGHADNQTSINSYGGEFRSNGSQGIGVYGISENKNASFSYGGYFVSRGTDGGGVYGFADNSSAARSYGGYFTSNAAEGIGVFAIGKTAGEFYGDFKVNEEDIFIDKLNSTVGIGTSNPATNLHIAHNDSNSGVGQGLRIHNTSSGFLNANWWNCYVQGSTGDLFFYGGDDATTGTLHFVIENSGDVGIGTANPTEKLEVIGNVKANNVTVPSDWRYKQNITIIDDAISSLGQINGYRYNYKTKDFPNKNFEENKQIGVIAQEVEKVFPELVDTDAEGYMSVNYANLTAVLVEAIKEQQKIIASLEKENSQLKNKDASLELRISKLESLLNVGPSRETRSK